MSKTRFLPKGVLLSQKDSVRAIKEYYFKFSEGCPVYPGGFEAHLPEEAKLVVESIQRRHASSRACIVAAPSWYTQTKGWEAYQEDIFCDLLLFDCQLGGLHLFTLFKSCSTARWDKEYIGYNAAKALKNALVLYGGCYEWFYIGYHTVYCCDCCSEIGSVFRTDLRNQYPHQYTCEEEEANEEKLNRILESLVSFLGAVPSLYSNEQGVCFFNLLTMEEFGSFYGAITPVDRNELLIGSVPGTERTVMHLRLISLCYGLVICEFLVNQP